MTDEKRRSRPAVQYGPTAAVVAGNVARLRKARGWTIYQLSALLRKAERAITPAAVGKIERQERQVSVDDLAALAVVFGVSPSALLLPLKDGPADTVEVTGAGSVGADVAWSWASSERPLRLPEEDTRTAMLEYQLYGLPPGRRAHLVHSHIKAQLAEAEAQGRPRMDEAEAPRGGSGGKSLD